MRNLLFIFIFVAVCGAQAADYPIRPIRMVVAYAPGGTTDFTARVVAPKLGELLGQTVVVDNRPGAGSILGTDLVAKGTPDGYTLLMADTTFGIIPAIYSKLPFNVQKDFATISQIMSVPKAMLNRISAETAKVVAMPEVRERIQAQHGEVVGSTPAEFAKFLAGEIASWTRVAKAGNIKAE